MILSFLTRALTLIFGYIFPAYDCYKTVELNKPEIEQLRFWCQYWILIAILTVFERVADNFVSWLPMYSEAKLALVVYLWYPKTRGTKYVYDTFFRAYVSRHEMEIDDILLQLRMRVGDSASHYLQWAVSYSQSRIYEVLQYIASQSDPQPSSGPRRPVQQQRSTPPHHHPPRAPPPPPPVPTNNNNNDNHQPQDGTVGPTGQGLDTEEGMQVDPADVASEETVMEEAIRATRGTLKRRVTAGVGPTPSDSSHH